MSPAGHTDVPDGAPQLPLTRAQIFWYSFASLGCGAFFSFNNYVLPLYLKQFTQNNVILGLTASTHSVEGAVIQPVVGHLSDGWRSPLGRRRPFMLAFLSLSAVLLLLTPACAALPHAVRLGAIVACIFLFTLTFNIGYDPYQALMPDITPVHQRGRVISVWTVLGMVGQAAILILKLPLTALFFVVGLTMVVSNVATCAATSEPHNPDSVTRRSPLEEARAVVRGLAVLRQASIALTSFAVAGAGLGVVTPYLTLFIVKVTGCSPSEAMMAAFVFMLSTMVTVMPVGWLVDRVGSKRVLYLAFALLAIACLWALRIHTLPEVYGVMIVAGLGNAGQSAAAYPLLTELVPQEEIGFYTGFQSTMLSIAQPITVSFTGVLINRGTYRVAFLVCGVAIAAAVAILRFVNADKGRAEVTLRRAAQEGMPR